MNVSEQPADDRGVPRKAAGVDQLSAPALRHSLAQGETVVTSCQRGVAFDLAPLES